MLRIEKAGTWTSTNIAAPAKIHSLNEHSPYGVFRTEFPASIHLCPVTLPGMVIDSPLPRAATKLS
jgi:hypothetical protein